jgi:hypothetical protein
LKPACTISANLSASVRQQNDRSKAPAKSFASAGGEKILARVLRQKLLTRHN